MGNLERAKNITTMEKLVLCTSIGSTSGTSIDFTGIPSWAKKITVMFDGVSTNGSSVFALRVGTSSGIATTGYGGSYGYTGSTIACWNQTTCFGLYSDSATDLIQGAIHLYLVNAATNTWACEGTMCWSTRPWTLPTSGTVTLSGTLDRIRITTVNGTDVFDAGSINIMYEG